MTNFEAQHHGQAGEARPLHRPGMTAVPRGRKLGEAAPQSVGALGDRTAASAVGRVVPFRWAEGLQEKHTEVQMLGDQPAGPPSSVRRLPRAGPGIRGFGTASHPLAPAPRPRRPAPPGTAAAHWRGAPTRASRRTIRRSFRSRLGREAPRERSIAPTRIVR